MSNAPTQQANRLDRRKARTRAALIRAAQTLIAEGRTNVPILEITQAADVGMGSFYNHFETKEQLFEAAVEAVMDGYGQLLDDLTADIEDPAEVFACSFRLTGRLHRREPELSRVLLNNVLRLLSADNGLAPRARRDIAAAVDAGRFDVEDLDVAVTMTAGALHRPRPAAARPAGPRRRGDHRPGDRGPAAHVRRARAGRRSASARCRCRTSTRCEATARRPDALRHAFARALAALHAAVSRAVSRLTKSSFSRYSSVKWPTTGSQPGHVATCDHEEILR